MEDAAGGDEVKGREGQAGEEEKRVLRKWQGQEEILEEEQSKRQEVMLGEEQQEEEEGGGVAGKWKREQKQGTQQEQWGEEAKSR